MGRRFAIAVWIFASLISTGPGESLLEEKGDAGSLAYFMDNDLYAGTDRYYTHGGRIAWRSASRTRSKLPGWAALMAYGLPHRPLADTAYQFGISLNHEIYTPSEILIPTLQLDDRPYAGLLSLGFSIHSRNDNTLDSLELAIGVVGPAALGEEAQSVVHRIQSINEPEGWDNQLTNEPFINLYYQKKWRLQGKQSANRSFSWDCIPQFGVSLGNVRTDANAGIT
ncbi:MAG: lipid A deacylase LpxR family protein, partial [Verrucomicrobiota bacterium]